VIALSHRYKACYAREKFGPRYWMATEDHDYDEIYDLNVKGKKVQSSSKASGAVGRFHTEKLEKL